jgi:hypothetical protein
MGWMTSYGPVITQTTNRTSSKRRINLGPPTLLDCLNSVPHLGHPHTHRVNILPSFFAITFPLKSQLGLLQIKDFDRILRLISNRTTKQVKKINQFIILCINPNQSGWKRPSIDWILFLVAPRIIISSSMWR